jgi:SAM-dependent methyltransferase
MSWDTTTAGHVGVVGVQFTLNGQPLGAEDSAALRRPVPRRSYTERQMDQGWFQDESFWREGYRFMFSDDAFAVAREQVDQLLALTGLENGRVLDLGCGPGRHVIPLALKGFEVTAVDASPFLLAKAREHAHRSSAAVEFIRSDMRSFERRAAFDLALSMFSSFGYFSDPEDDRRVLVRLCQSLRPGGRALLDLMGKELTCTSWGAQVTESEGVTRVERHRIVENWTRVESEWILLAGASVQRFTFSVRIYSGQELMNLLADAGFGQVSLYGDLDGRPYGPGARRLVAVARKE